MSEEKTTKEIDFKRKNKKKWKNTSTFLYFGTDEVDVGDDRLWQSKTVDDLSEAEAKNLLCEIIKEQKMIDKMLDKAYKLIGDCMP